MDQPCQLRRITHQGFEALELTNGQIYLVVLPELGGKIASIRHMASGTEWLWSNPHLSYRKPVFDASYIREFDFGGLDECFPSVAPAFYPTAPWAGTPVPDHGELWSQPWKGGLAQSTGQRVTLALACHGVRFPYRFERTITIEAGSATARLDYRVANLSPFVFPFVWSIHPLLPLSPGMKLMLPVGVAQVRVDFSTEDWLGKTGELQSWPTVIGRDGQAVDMSQIPPPSFGRGVKLFTLPLQGRSPVETVLADAAGERSFCFRFLPTEITHVGVWINCAGWTPLDLPPYYNLALEPCIGASDSLNVAVNQWREHGVLGPSEEKTWSLEIALT